MILVIDTSSSIAAIATIDERTGQTTDVYSSARSPELVPQLRRLAASAAVTKVAVATGPGSFTGLRVGVGFGLGLAMGLKVPIVPLPTLDLQAARSEKAVIPVVEAGRGRFYFRVPGAAPRLGEPAEIPRTLPLAGRVSPKGMQALQLAGHAIEPENQMRGFGEAARKLLETAREVAYGSLEVEYMQTFSARL